MNKNWEYLLNKDQIINKYKSRLILNSCSNNNRQSLQITINKNKNKNKS